MSSRKTNARKPTPARRSSRPGVNLRPLSRPSNPTFGSVSTINTAPVAIGNSMQGFKSRTIPVPGGIRIIGRDYGFTPTATGTVTGWTMAGGMPISPTCMPTTILRNFVQMYAKWKCNSITAHYITSSSTVSTGDITFYSQKQGSSSMVNWSASSFLSFVLSEPENVIGPQWTNHSITIRPKTGWNRCDAYMNGQQGLDSSGDIFLMSKTSTTDSPGYIVLDYDFTFMELEYNPRAASLPLGNAQWTPFNFAFTGVKTIGTAVSNATSGTAFIGGTSITAFASQNIGDVFKIIVDVTNSTFVNTTTANFLEDFVAGSTGVAETLRDGFTMFAVNFLSGRFVFYPNLESALVGGASLDYGVSVTYAEILLGYAKYVGTVNSGKLQYNV